MLHRLLVVLRPIALRRVGYGGLFVAGAVAIFAMGSRPLLAIAAIVVPAAWFAISVAWWFGYRRRVRGVLRSLGHELVDAPIVSITDSERLDLTGGSRDFAEDRRPRTPTFAHTGGHAVAIGAPRGRQWPQVGVWATPIRMVDARPWWRRMTIHSRGRMHTLTFVHLRLPSPMPGFIFRDRALIDWAESRELDLESIDLSRARRFVLERDQLPVDVALAIDPPTILWLLEHPHLEFEAYGRDLVAFDPRTPVRAEQVKQLVRIASKLRDRIASAA